MKTMNFALVALAGLGLVTSQVAVADTLPAAAVPTATAKHLHAPKMVRLAEKRRAGDSDAAAPIPLLAYIVVPVAAGAIVYAAVKTGQSVK